MKRKIYDVLLEWKKDGAGKTALLIDGARRVGKSYIVEEFAKAEYKTYLMIDFNRVNDEVKDLFNNYLNDLDSLFMYLSVYYNVKLYPHESLIIFDEVQMYPRARAAIKYLVADGRYDYIETGSLMSIKKNVQDILARDQDVPLPRNQYTDPSYMQNVIDHEYGLYTDLAKKARQQADYLNNVRQFGANQGEIVDSDNHSFKG